MGLRAYGVRRNDYDDNDDDVDNNRNINNKIIIIILFFEVCRSKDQQATWPCDLHRPIR